MKKEVQRLKRLLKKAEVDPERIQALEPVIDNVAWMRAKLDEIREEIVDEGIVIAYDNGGGQTGVRENPAYKAYESLWKSYMLGVAKILEALPAQTAKEEKKEIDEGKPKNVLALVQAKHA